MRACVLLVWVGATAGATLAGCTLIAGVAEIPLLEAGADGRADAPGLPALQDAGGDVAQATCTLDGGTPTSAPACNACLATYCCPQVQTAFIATSTFASANAFLSCSAQCMNSDAGPLCSYSSCIESNPNGFQAAQPYIACSNYNCAGPCPFLGTTNGCSDCIMSTGGPFFKCAEDPACDRKLTCFTTCTPDAAACRAGCAALDGGANFGTYLTATATSSCPACNFQ